MAAVSLALCLVLPFLTGQIPEIGSMLCPMHIPVLLCGFLCGPVWAGIVGAIAPLLRFTIFGMPPILPTGVAMCFELLTYGLLSGLLYRLLPKKPHFVYASLLIAMLCGRLVWGTARLIIAGLTPHGFSWALFLADGFTGAIPGIILQIILIPVLVIALQRALPWMKKAEKSARL
ncbi:MAG: ECF transporter S component [Clostridiales bacterium]|nr:ECF transporter S component [Clostridiales bacterium]